MAALSCACEILDAAASDGAAGVWRVKETWWEQRKMHEKSRAASGQGKKTLHRF